MITGIIAEYNPFHNGHKYQIDTLRKNFCTGIVCIMSGSFVQRGEPAVIDKFSRARCALKCGADVVIELPCVYSTAAADIFALGAVDILNKIRADKICFGSENADIDTLEKAAIILSKEPAEFKKKLKEKLSMGISYPAARLRALSEYMNTNLDMLSKPNNILALEYMKSIKILGSTIEPFAVERIGSDFNDTKLNKNFSSASAIRKALKENNELIFDNVPPQTYDIIKKISYVPSIDDYSDILRYVLIKSSPEAISQICDITEGLENRILKFRSKPSVSEIISCVKTKRYTMTKIQRGLLHIMLDIKKSDISSYIKNGINEYVRILGFRKGSAHILSEICKNSAVPVITSVKNTAFEVLKKEFFASDLYYINSTRQIDSDFRTPLVIV